MDHKQDNHDPWKQKEEERRMGGGGTAKEAGSKETGGRSQDQL